MFKKREKKNVAKMVFFIQKKRYRFLLQKGVEKGQKWSYESWQKTLKILDFGIML